MLYALGSQPVSLRLWPRCTFLLLGLLALLPAGFVFFPNLFGEGSLFMVSETLK